MNSDRQLDQRISKWLEGEAPRQLPDRVLSATFERTRKMPQRGGWRGLVAKVHVVHFMPSLSAAVVLVLVVALAAGLWANRPGIGGTSSPTPPIVPTASSSATETPSVAPTPTESPAPTPTPSPTPSPTHVPPTPVVAEPFLGRWYAIDPAPESSHLTMDIGERPDGDFDILIVDDAAAVCATVPSTMTGVAQQTEPGTLVITKPKFVCDDGSKPHSLNGQPMADLLRNYTFVYDEQQDQLQEPEGLLWSRSAPTQP
ncbi:MAG: hypothetical protein QOJ81_2154 [Chloroflexota bacterium]|jgi:hypothetical protein|nr:hypothetical protein [Chloroflexota bacterium]